MTGLIVFIILLIVGYITGTLVERRHYNSIIARERSDSTPLVFSARTIPDDADYTEVGLVSGSVVISVDYFKSISARLRAIAGGRIGGYESLIDRARREAVLRMKKDARTKNASMIFGVRFETASISKGRGRSIGSVEVLAYGSGVRARHERPQSAS